MKIEIKRNLIIFRIPAEWEKISARIVKEHGASILISWKCRRELGFTIRHHKGLVKWSDNNDNKDCIESDLKNRYHYEDQIHLDFYSESAMSFFMLKYIN
jgi:hypothetical protein